MGREDLGTVTTYEILLMLDPEQAEARQDDVIARTRQLVEKGDGTWQSHDAWGRRRLAYPIAHKEEGVYHLVVFDAEPATLEEISRVLKIEDAVLRHLATRHIAGSRTSAPRDDAAAVAAAPSEVAVPDEPAAVAARSDETVADETAAVAAQSEEAVSEDAEPEYAGAEEQTSEEAGEKAGEEEE
jgi:small subunit ribosomal protein S6